MRAACSELRDCAAFSKVTARCRCVAQLDSARLRSQCCCDGPPEGG